MTPNRIWNRPQNKPAIDIAISTSLNEPCDEAQTPEMSDAVMTVIGPVGPLICECVPPNRAAKKPSRVAPTKPARAPIELAAGSSMPPKACIPNASANGKATIPAVMPPKISPFKFFVVKNAI